MQKFKIYGFASSGNCNKVRFVADLMGYAYEWIETDSPTGATRTDQFLDEINPAGQVPAVVFADGRKLAQSNALMIYLAGDSDLIPKDAFEHAQMLSWMFWEQYSHEPHLAVRRALLQFKGKTEKELDPSLLENGNAALMVMELQLAKTKWLVGDAMTLADIALVAYTRTAPEGGFDLEAYPGVHAWVKRLEKALDIV
jgi:glutathione S-transferase